MTRGRSIRVTIAGECGAYLWIERCEIDDSTLRTEHSGRYRYRQGPALPEGYRGWMSVTQ